jgi:predicted transcriptional regulator
MPSPEKEHRFGFVLPVELRSAFLELAKRNDRTISAELRRAIRQYLERELDSNREPASR